MNAHCDYSAPAASVRCVMSSMSVIISNFVLPRCRSHARRIVSCSKRSSPRQRPSATTPAFENRRSTLALVVGMPRYALTVFGTAFSRRRADCRCCVLTSSDVARQNASGSRFSNDVNFWSATSARNRCKARTRYCCFIRRCLRSDDGRCRRRRRSSRRRDRYSVHLCVVTRTPLFDVHVQVVCSVIMVTACTKAAKTHYWHESRASGLWPSESTPRSG